MSLSRDQEALLELLVKVKEFLDENNIRFYLFGGSCIGALRHRGFIPWDDDVDIIMDRENYQKLIKASENMPRDDIEFWCFEKHDAYFKAFGQFSSKKDTYFLKSRVFNQGLCMGTLIDVLVMDFVPSDKLEEYKKNLVLYEEVLGFYRMHRDEICDYKDEYFELVERERNEGRRKVVEELQSQIMKYSKEESDLLVTSFWVRKLRQYKKEWFGEPRYCEFEGHMMPIPAKAEATLRYQYGNDWHLVPREEQRRVHNFYVNHDISNNNYVEDMEKFLHVDDIPALMEARKHHQVERLAQQLIMRKTHNQLTVKRLELELINAIEEKDYPQFEPIVKNLKAFEETKTTTISDSTILGWMKWLIDSGRVADASKVADAFLPNCKFGSWREDELQSKDLNSIDCSVSSGMIAMLEQLLLLDASRQDNDLKEMEAILANFPESMQSSVPSCILASVRLAINEKAAPAKLEELLVVCQNYLEKHQDNYDVIKAQGDIFLALSRVDEANAAYDLVRTYSRNGLDLLELE